MTGRAILASLLVVATLSGCAASRSKPNVPDTAVSTITIGIVGDQTGTTNLDAAYAVLQKGAETLAAAKPDLVLHVGDLVESAQTPAEITQRFAQATGLLARIGKPYWLTAGDHDVNPPAFVQNSPDRGRETLFRDLYKAINPRVAEKLYYSFDAGGYHFVSLYALEHLHTDPRWGNVFFSRLSDKQFDWLANDLAAANNARTNGIVVFLHQPLWYNWAGWSRVHALLAKERVTAVIAGHYHYNQQDTVLDGVTYRVVGATGGTTKTGSPNAGDLQHVTLASVKGREIAFRMFPLSTPANPGFTERRAMDQVQAIDQMLGNLYSFPTDNPVSVKGTQLVADCATGRAATLTIKGIGNPLGVTLTTVVSIQSALPGFGVSNPAFAANACSSSSGGMFCETVPSFNIGVSNTSVVELAYNAVPLWTGTPTITSAPGNLPTTIRLKMKQSFSSAGQLYIVEKEASTLVNACPN